ncbi:MAG: diacylglycerol kinase family lipid kinase [Planctomycetota bacterium]|jgi:YegS/Rv2252/BmrU family lipid kinase
MLDPERTTVVVNPAAGSGRVGRRWGALQPGLAAALGDVEFAVSDRPGGVVDLARAAVERGHRTVLSLGGDGTHNEVVNGIMAASPAPGEVRFGVLPSGTGGDFARILEAPRDPLGAARALLDAPESPLDLGRVTIRSESPASARYFVNVGTFGMSGLIDTLVKGSSTVLGGRASFYIASVRGLLKYRPARVRLTADGEDLGEFEINTVALGNAQYCGGGMHMTPSADPGDGWLEGVIIEQRSFLRMLTLTTSIYRGKHTRLDFVRTFRARRLDVELIGDRPAFLDLDGEPSGVVPATFEVVPGALTLLGKLSAGPR